MDLLSLLLAPVRLPFRVVSALDDLAALAERARREPDPVEEVRQRLDLALIEIAQLNQAASQVVPLGADLTRLARELHSTMQEVLAVGHGIVRTGLTLDSTGRDIHDGGEDLTAVAKALEGDTRELIEGGERLTEVAARMEADLKVLRAAMPRLLDGLDSVEELEGAVETVADTVEPLQGTAERVGRFTRRLSRRPD